MKGRGRRPRLAFGVAAAVGAAVLWAGCGGGGSSSSTSASSKGPIVIGESIGKSGFLTAFDLPPSAGAHIAADEINAQGGIDGRKIEFKTIDNQSDANQSFQAAKSLVDQGAQILLGSCNFEQAAPTARVANQNHMLFYSYCGGEPRLTQQVGTANQYSFDMGNETNGVGASMAQFANSKGFKHVYLLEDTSINYSQEMCNFFKTAFAQYPGTSIVGQDTFQNTDASVASQITRIKSQSPPPDAVVLCSYLPGGATALRQLRAAGINTPVVTGDGMDGTSLFKAVPNLSNFYQSVAASVYGDDPEPKVQDLVDKYTQQTGHQPEGSYLVFGYSIIQAIQAAMQKDGNSTDGSKLRDALQTFRNQPLLVGPLTYTDTQHVDPFRPEKIIQVQGGKPSYLTTETLQQVPNPFGGGFLQNPAGSG